MFHLEKTKNTPEIYFDEESGTLKLTGRSIPENADSFYKSLIAEVENYKKNPAELLTIIFDLEYFNTSSAKMILFLLRSVKEVNSEIIWIFEKDDEDMREAGEDYKAILPEVPFEFRIKEE